MLERIKANEYHLNGIVDFYNAVEVECKGSELLERYIKSGDHFVRLSLQDLQYGDSSVISVCLSWIRLLIGYNVAYDIVNLPTQLQGLVGVCGLDDSFFHSNSIE